MIDGGLYVICARQAFVGMWSSADDGFVIARNKFTTWYLFVESHWDDELYFDGVIANRGTAMPLRVVGCILDKSGVGLLEFLKQVEIDNPIVDGWDSVEAREQSNKAYLQRMINNKVQRKVPIYKQRKKRKEATKNS